MVFNFCNRIILMIFMALLAGCEMQYGPEFEARVEDAVRHQMEMYPQSRLQDIYKNFAQDRFGPGHLIPDASRADVNLRRELAEMACETDSMAESPGFSDPYGPFAEPVGWEENFVRVNLSVVRDSLVPYDLFLDAFVRSAKGVEKVSLPDWKYEWREILHVIERMNLDLPDFEDDKKRIEELFMENAYVMHHSDSFMKAYHPHYRIVRSEIFLNEIFALINQAQ